MEFPEGHQPDKNLLEKFKDTKKSEFDSIDAFIFEVKEWQVKVGPGM